MRLHGRVAARLAGPATLVAVLAFPPGAAAASDFRDRVFSGPVARSSELRGRHAGQEVLHR